jgi:hypothetical protein
VLSNLSHRILWVQQEILEGSHHVPCSLRYAIDDRANYVIFLRARPQTSRQNCSCAGNAGSNDLSRYPAEIQSIAFQLLVGTHSELCYIYQTKHYFLKFRDMENSCRETSENNISTK